MKLALIALALVSSSAFALVPEPTDLTRAEEASITKCVSLVTQQWPSRVNVGWKHVHRSQGDLSVMLQDVSGNSAKHVGSCLIERGTVTSAESYTPRLTAQWVDVLGWKIDTK